MGLFNKPKLSEPNEMGFQFGIDESLTEYAHKEQLQWGGSSLPGVKITVLEVWKDGQRVSYLLIDEKTNEPVKEAQGYEAAAVAIDVFKALKQSELIENK
jgi:hypothetical protein